MKENYLSKCTLLYVEDDENIRNMLKKRLEKKVKNIYIACDGAEGLEKFNEYRPDIILTDVSMPKMNGIEMSRHIKEIDNNVPIVISSAHGDTKYLIESIELGISGYLLKPIDKIKLFEILEKNVKTVLIEQKLIEQKNKMLEQSRFALLGEMVSMIAHQWRQPLNVISMQISNLRVKFALDKYELDTDEGRKNLPDKLEEDFKKIDNRVQFLSSTINEFATLYKPRDYVESANINYTLKEVIENFKHSLQFGETQIIEHYNSSKNVELYKDVFMQICLNILNNANEKFIQNEIKNPKIDIYTNDCEDGIELVFLDNAGGIPKEIMDKIFDPYFSTKIGKNGNGLGLYMTKLVIEEHLNGEVSVNNFEDGIKLIIKLRV